MKNNAGIYTVGGTVQAGEGIYIPRKADDSMLDLCQNGALAYVLTPRQMGKSSLMIRTAERLSEQDIRSVIIDLSQIGTHQKTEDLWYAGLLVNIEDQLNLNIDALAWWSERQHLPATFRFTQFFEEVLTHHVTGSVVVFIDEIDSTLNLPFASDFYAAIRFIYNDRAKTPVFNRLSFVLIGVASPGELIHEKERTPFNVGERVDLTDFTEEEALPLAKGFGLPDPEARQLLRWILKWTGGHPFLTQRVCRIIAQSDQSDWTEREVDAEVHSIFFGEEKELEGNLQFVRDMLIRRAPKGIEVDVLETYLNILKSKRGREEDKDKPLVNSHLKLSGIVKRNNKALVVRNPIYAHVFDAGWVKANSPLTWIQRNSDVLIRWLAVGFGLMFVLAAFAAFAAYTLFLTAEQQRAIAEANEKEAVENQELAEQRAQEARFNAKRADSLTYVATLQRNIADSLAKVAIDQRQSARDSAVVANSLRLLAERETQRANESAAEADNLRKIAEANAAIAETNAAEASRARLQTLGLALAAQSLQQLEYSQDTLAALLAFEAFIFSNTSGGKYRNEVFNALQQSWAALQDRNERSVTISDNEEVTEIRDAVFRPMEPPVIAYGQEDGVVKVWEESFAEDTTGSTVRFDPLSRGKPGEISRSIAFSPNGDKIASIIGQTVWVWSDQRLEEGVSTTNTAGGIPLNVLFLPNSTQIAYSSGNRVILWNPESNRKAQFGIPDAFPDREIQAMAIRPGEALIVGCSDGSIWKWRLPEDPTDEITSLPPPERILRIDERKGIFAIALSRLGHLLAEGGEGGTVRIWDVDKDSLLHTLIGHRGRVNALAFSDSLLASAGGDQTVRLYRIEEFDVSPIVLIGHQRWVRSVSFSPDGKQLVSGSADGTVRLWDIDASQLADDICRMVGRPLQKSDWDAIIGEDVAYRTSCMRQNANTTQVLKN